MAGSAVLGGSEGVRKAARCPLHHLGEPLTGDIPEQELGHAGFLVTNNNGAGEGRKGETLVVHLYVVDSTPARVRSSKVGDPPKSPVRLPFNKHQLGLGSKFKSNPSFSDYPTNMGRFTRV